MCFKSMLWLVLRRQSPTICWGIKYAYKKLIITKCVLVTSFYVFSGCLTEEKSDMSKFISLLLWSIAGILIVLLIFGVAVLLRYFRKRKLGVFFSLADRFLIPIKFFGVGPFGKGELTVENCLSLAMETTRINDLGDAESLKKFVGAYNIVSFLICLFILLLLHRY